MQTGPEGYRTNPLSRSSGVLPAVVSAVLLISTLTLGSSTAQAVDINGLVNAAIAIGAAYGRVPLGRYSHHAVAKRDRDSDESEDEDSGGGGRKSAATPQHRPTSITHHSMEASSDSDDAVVSLDRSRE